MSSNTFSYDFYRLPEIRTEIEQLANNRLENIDRILVLMEEATQIYQRYNLRLQQLEAIMQESSTSESS